MNMIGKLINHMNQAAELATREKIDIKWRPYQLELFESLKSDNKNLFVSQGRRLGKDYSVFYYCIQEAIKRPNTRIIYFFPTIAQGVRAIFEGITNENEGWLESLIEPELLVTPKASSKLHHYDNSIRFKNGSIIRILGADKTSNKVGSSENIIVFSEAAHVPKLEVFLNRMIPSVAKIKGRIILVSTPNYGSHFNEMYLKGLNPDAWTTSIVPASKAFEADGVTPVYTEEDLELLKSTMSKEEFKQELECNFEINNTNSIYGASFEEAIIDDSGQLGKELYISADLGIADFSVFTFMRRTERGSMRVVHHLGINGVGSKAFSDYFDSYIKEHGIVKEAVTLLMPFDSINRQRGYDNVTSTFDQLKQAGWRCVLVRKAKQKEGIDITRRAIQQGNVEFDTNQNVHHFINKLKQYQYKMNTDGTNTYIPDHGREGDSPSNYADSLEYGMIHFFSKNHNQNRYQSINTFFEN